LENDALLARCPEGSCVIDGTALPGPLALLIPDRAEDRIAAARLVARYSDKRKEAEAMVLVDGRPVTVSTAGEVEAVAE
jgi:hypothetical protein